MKTFIGLVAAAAGLAIPSVAVAHEGAPVAVINDRGSASITIPFDGCNGVPGIVSVDLKFRVHVTEFDDGHFLFSSMDWGTYQFTPSVGLGSTGHYRNGTNEVFTPNAYVNQRVFVGSGEFEDGSHAPFGVHFQFVASNGEVRVENATVRCNSD